LKEAAEETRHALPFLVKDAQTEITAIWKHKPPCSPSIWCRCRIDVLMPDLWIWDLKFTEDAALAAADRNIASNGYHIQAAANIDAVENLVEGAAGRVHFGLCFVEWQNPAIGIKRREIRGELLDVGQRQWTRAKTVWLECQATNKWPGYSSDIIEAQCPAWIASDELEQQIERNDGKEPF